MTASDVRALACPACGAVDSIAMDAGTRLCLSCTHEWAPGDAAPTTAPAAGESDQRVSPTHSADALPPPASAYDEAVNDLPPVILRSPNAAGVLGGPSLVLRAHDALIAPRDVPELVDGEAPDWSGAFVIHEPQGRHALVVDDDGGLDIEVSFANGFTTTVPRDECTLVPITETEVLDGAEADDAGDVRALGDLVMTCAALVLAAGASCIPNNGEQSMRAPATGWAPPPADEAPELEAGAAYAVAMVINTFGIDPREVETMSANLLAMVSADQQQEGVTDNGE